MEKTMRSRRIFRGKVLSMDSKTVFLLLAGLQFTLSSLTLPALAAETKASPDTPAAATTSVIQGAEALTPDPVRAFEGEWKKRMQALRQRKNSLSADAAGGNDGLKTGEFGFHTNATPEPSWWQVDLQAVCPLDRVVVFNRNTIAQRALLLKILLSDDGQNWKEAYQHDGSLFLGGKQKPLTVPLPGQKARFVRIQIPVNEYLHLDEVEVYGADDKDKNIALKKPALQSSISNFSTFTGAVPDAPFDQNEVNLARELVANELAGASPQDNPLLADSAQLAAAGPSEGNRLRWIALYAQAAAIGQRIRETRREIETLNPEALRLAIEDLARTFPDQYPKAAEYLQTLKTLEQDLPAIREGVKKGDEKALARARQIADLRREALLANPLLDFDKLLFIKRGENRLGLPQNWQGNCAVPSTEYDNEIDVLSPVRPDGTITTFFRPQKTEFVGDVDLNFDGDKMLFSMPGSHGRWQIWEILADGTGLRQVTPGEEPDVDNYDPCYLPDGRIIYGSTRFMHGVPCVDGANAVANLCVMNANGQNLRQLCFDQDHNWCPTLLPNGQVLYARWEYADLPHAMSRLLFQMNPDGTNQVEYYGSNSAWPNSLFYARPLPSPDPMNRSAKFVGIVSGHHGVPRMGEMVIFDPSVSRREEQGAIQRIPQRGKKVEQVYQDQLVDASWPKFLHPWPLSEKYFLVSAQPTADSLWGLYLVDVFDNMLLLKEEPGYVYFEPVPLKKQPKPPVIPDRVNLNRQDGVVYVSDIYSGPGLKGVPRGTVKNLRVFTYVWGYQTMGGLLGVIGMDGPWDIRRILGTVPVQEDGSAMFRVPANTPIAIQPLDESGAAVQVMRSWMTAMPGENLSCGGCHEGQNAASPARRTLAARQAPSEIQPWRGPVRGFSFAREVQPVLDKYCVGCHDGTLHEWGKTIPNLRGDVPLKDWSSITPGNGGRLGGKFSIAYAELHKFVRRPGIESDYHLLNPMEFHASTTELVQMLKKGHHNVQLDEEAWDRLYTWMDLNAPFHGAWSEIDDPKQVEKLAKRRQKLAKGYLAIADDIETLPPIPAKAAFVKPEAESAPAQPASSPNWPFSAEEAAKKQTQAAAESKRTIPLGPGLNLELTLVPAGQFVMGNPDGSPQERPATPVTVAAPFWMGRFEITNAQFAQFDPVHDSHVEPKHAYQFGVHGFPVNEPEQPVVRVSWEHAMEFCRWLSEKTGETFTLPTEAQWEYACRAGSATPFSYGDLNTDFSKFANLADRMLIQFADDPYKIRQPLLNPTPYDDWIPKDARFDDGGFVSEKVGKYAPNAWGLYDMHGNVWEWTRSAAQPYPYQGDDGRNTDKAGTERIARGGSWYDRPQRATSSYRLGFRPWQRVFNVGFRVVSPVKAAGSDAQVAEGK